MDVFTQQERDEGMDAYWNDCGLRVDATLRINYCGSDGSPTERTIDVTHFADDMIRAHCRLRNEIRTFRADRITSCVDAASGNSIAAPLDYLFDLYKLTPDYSLDRAFGEWADVIRALVYILSVGGKMNSLGTAAIGFFCRKATGDHRLTDQAIMDQVESLGEQSLTSYRRVAGRLSKQLNAQSQNALLQMATKITEAGGGPDKYEAEAIAYLQKRFNEGG